MYLTSVQDDAIRMRDLAEGPGAQARIVVQDARLRWPDTFSEGPDGTIYVTASHIMDMPWFVPENPLAVRTTLFRVAAGG
jgi:hypothetical protein